MSVKSIPMNMPCPICGKPMNFKMKGEIFLPDDIGWKEKIMNNSLFAIKCNKCKVGMNGAYSLTYDDMERKYFIWVLPTVGEKEINKMLAYNERMKTDDVQRLARKDYRMRAVRDDKDLKEKIMIFDSGLDDRIVEIMKLNYIPILRQKYNVTNDITGFYFTVSRKTGAPGWIIFFKDRRPMVGPFSVTQYNELKRDLQELIDLRTVDGVTFINAKWAVDTMRIRMSGDPSKEKINAQELIDNYKKKMGEAVAQVAAEKAEQGESEEKAEEPKKTTKKTAAKKPAAKKATKKAEDAEVKEEKPKKTTAKKSETATAAKEEKPKKTTAKKTTKTTTKTSEKQDKKAETEKEPEKKKSVRKTKKDAEE